MRYIHLRWFLDAIASPSTYPCQWVSEWVSEWVGQWLIVSDLEIAIASPSFVRLFSYEDGEYMECILNAQYTYSMTQWKIKLNGWIWLKWINISNLKLWPPIFIANRGKGPSNLQTKTPLNIVPNFNELVLSKVIHSEAWYFFFNIYLRCFEISSEGAGYRYSIEYKITFIVIVLVHCFFFSLLMITYYDELFQGPKVANCTGIEIYTSDGLQIYV